jgi:NADH-quinone oxidoreductase subunit M
MIFMHENLLAVLLFLPFVGALIILPLRNRDQHALIRWISLAVGLLEFVLSFIPVYSIPPGSSGMKLEVVVPWIPQWNISFHLGVDGISIFLVHLITLLTPIGVLASWSEIKHQVKEFHILLLLLEMGVIGVLISLDLFLFFFWWEFSLIPLALLIGIWGHGRRIYAAVKFVLFTMGGSIFMLVAIIWLHARTGTFDIIAIEKMIQSGQLALSPNTEMWLFLGFFVAFAVKLPMFPLHTWLPDAHTEAPTAGSADLAGVLLKLGGYGIIRICLPFFPGASHRAAPVIGVLSVIAIIYGALVSMVQPNLKKLVAYSSVSHMGFVTLGLFSFSIIGFQGAIYVMLAHGITSSALFLLCGMLYERRHTYEIREFGGLATPMPRYATVFLIASLAAIGLPLLCGFVGEFLVLSGTFQMQAHWAVWAATGVIFSSCYMLWAYQRVFYGEVTLPENRQLQDINHRERWVMVGMCILMLWLGVHANFFLRRYEMSCQAILQQASPNPKTETGSTGQAQPLNRPISDASPQALNTVFGR